MLYIEAIARARELGLAALVAQTLADVAAVQIDVGAWTRPVQDSRRPSAWRGHGTADDGLPRLSRQAEIAARQAQRTSSRS